MSELEEMRALADRVYDLRQRYYELIEAKLIQDRGPPATEAEINDFERQTGKALPPSYKQFLRLHNGWSHWEGDIRMLSLKDMLAGPYATWVRTWQKEAILGGDDVIENGLVIACELNAASGLVLDLSAMDTRGEYEIVSWENGPVTRYHDMFELLEDDAEEWESLLNEALNEMP